MRNLTDLSSKVIQFISASFLDGNKQLKVDTPLMELNILDSVSVFDVIDFLSSEFKVKIPLHEIHPGNFQSVLKLEQLVKRLTETSSFQYAG